MTINKDLIKYIESNILPQYELNDKGHGLDHIQYVLRRSLKFAEQCNQIDFDMVYTIACYHDIGHHINAKKHEEISAQILLNDDNLNQFFNKEQIEIMAQAVADHRASNEQDPHSIYGKIVSSADRNTDFISIFKRTYQYRIAHGMTDLEEIMKGSQKHVIEKFGNNGYAKSRMYFKDEEYEKFLNDIENIAYDDNKFRKIFYEVNGLSIPEPQK